jgi:uncharacterized Zn finger protein (UPF0148 family)
MNLKIDSGWKLTDLSCKNCKFSLLVNLETKRLYCSKCDLISNETIEIKYEGKEKQLEDSTPEEH